MLVTTIEALPGYRVLRILGEVIGITLRGSNPYAEGLKRVTGGKNPQAQQALLNIRAAAVEAMVDHARRLGANAVVGMRFDHRAISGFIEICAYGTAVLAEPAPVAAGTPAP